MEQPDFSAASAFGVEIQSSVDRRGNARLQAVDDARGLLAEACARARLDRGGWHRQATPRGELSLVPATVPRSRLAVDLVGKLVEVLSRRNRDRAAVDRLRLRVAIHHGTPGRRGARTNGPGAGGSGASDAAADGDADPPAAVVRRLLDAPQVSFSLDVRDADLALIVSDPLYKEVRAVSAGDFRPESFRRVSVRDRGVDCVHLSGAAELPATGLLAWIQIPDQDPAGIPPAED